MTKSVIGSLAMEFSDEQAMLLDVAREFCRDKSPMDVVRANLETDTGYDAAVWQEMVDLGWAGIALPESVGGAGLNIGAAVPVMEAMGRALLGTPLLSTTLAGQLLARAGGAQAEPWLAKIAAGTVATVAHLESADWGSESYLATIDSNGLIDGRKSYVGDAGVADIFIVVVSADDNPALAMVTRAQLGADAVQMNTLIDLTKRSGKVDFSGVTVSQDALITGPAVATALRDFRLLGALLVAAEAAGTAASCLDTVVEYLKTRKQFGKLIGSYQALKHPMVDILCGVDNARSFVYHAATVLDDEPLSEDAEVACRMAKSQATDILEYAGDRAVQFHGGIGFTWDCNAQLFIRRAQWVRQAFGDALHHRKRLANSLLDQFL